MIDYWLSLGGDALSTFVAIAILYEGARLLSSQGLSRKAVLTTIFGAVMCVTLAGIHFVKYRVVNSSIKVVEIPTIPENLPPPTEWSKSLTPVERETVGRQIAGAQYQQSGAITTYLDRAQQPVPFVPTQQESKDRESRVAGLAVLRQLEGDRFGDAMRWVVWIGLAVLYGVTVGRASRNGR